MEILALFQFLFDVAIKYGIPGVQKIMAIWDVEKPTLDQIRELKDMPKPEEFFK